MRVDRCLAIVVMSLLTISSMLLVYGILTASTLSQNRRDDVASAGGHLKLKQKQQQHQKQKQRAVAANGDETSAPSPSLSRPPHLLEKRKGYIWGDKAAHDIGWAQQAGDRCSEEYHRSLTTYDDLISAGVDRETRSKQQQHHDSSSSDSSSSTLVCDPYTVPFNQNPAAEARCLSAMRDPDNWESVEMIQPKFEQRTVKYIVTLKNKNNNNEEGDTSNSNSKKKIRLLMKVPQSSFATEPFSEITAFELDRALHMNRIPPTVLVPFPLERLHAAADEVMGGFKMVMELGYTESNFTKWWTSEFYKFVQKSNSPRVMVNETHVWVSLQLRLEEVAPLLDSPLRVPYSKKHSGWHRWFNPLWEGFAAVTNTTPVEGVEATPQPGYERYSEKPYSELLHASMLALSELSIFDFLMLNNDRSPNKNNFVVDGCYTKRKWQTQQQEQQQQNQQQQLLPQKGKEKFCSKDQLAARSKNGNSGHRAALGHAMTFVHLDQGMSFHGFSFVNNPVQKKVNNTFCLFYRPTMERVRCFLAEHAQDAARAEAVLKERVPDVAQRVLGRKKLKWMVGQLSLLIEKRDSCIARFGEEVVMQPGRSPLVV